MLTKEQTLEMAGGLGRVSEVLGVSRQAVHQRRTWPLELQVTIISGCREMALKDARHAMEDAEYYEGILKELQNEGEG